jgi:hypothetical protein
MIEDSCRIIDGADNVPDPREMVSLQIRHLGLEPSDYALHGSLCRYRASGRTSESV